MSLAAYAMTVIVIVPLTLLLLDIFGSRATARPNVAPIVPDTAAPDLDRASAVERPRPVAAPAIRPGDGMVYRGPLVERR